MFLIVLHLLKEMNIQTLGEPFLEWGVCDTHCEEYFKIRDQSLGRKHSATRITHSQFIDYKRSLTEASVTILTVDRCNTLLRGRKKHDLNVSTEICAGRNTEVEVDVWKLNGMTWKTNLFKHCTFSS